MIEENEELKRRVVECGGGQPPICIVCGGLMYRERAGLWCCDCPQRGYQKE